MSTTVEGAVRRASMVTNRLDVGKGIWPSPAGKHYLAKRIVREIPDHRVYVEPFAGGAQVFFSKEPSETEVLNDMDKDIAFAFRFAKRVNSQQLRRLRRLKWEGDRRLFVKLRDASPSDPVLRFHRFAYLGRFSFNATRAGTMPHDRVGKTARVVDKLERNAPRLRRVRVSCADYQKVIERYDGPRSFFFIDPPYAGYNALAISGTNHSGWDEERLVKVLKRIKGRFFCTYGIRGRRDLFRGFTVRRWRHMSGVGAGLGKAGCGRAETLIVTNYTPAAREHRRPVKEAA